MKKNIDAEDDIRAKLQSIRHRWKILAAVELATLAFVCAVMIYSGAPTWAFALMVLISGQPTRAGLAYDLSVLQVSIRAVARNEAWRTISEAVKIVNEG